MYPEIDLLTLAPEEWGAMRSAAAELDLVRGGYFRLRGESIFFYCDPDNAPEGWSGEFVDDPPRALVGEAEVNGANSAGDLEVQLLVSNWDAMREVKQAYDRGDYKGRYFEFLAAQEAAFRGREQDREWLRRQFRRLQSHAAGSLLDG